MLPKRIPIAFPSHSQTCLSLSRTFSQTSPYFVEKPSRKSKPTRSNFPKPKPIPAFESSSSAPVSSNRIRKYVKPKYQKGKRKRPEAQEEAGFFSSFLAKASPQLPWINLKGLKTKDKEDYQEEEGEEYDDIEAQIDSQPQQQERDWGNPFPRPKLQIKSLIHESTKSFLLKDGTSVHNPFLEESLGKESLLEKTNKKSVSFVWLPILYFRGFFINLTILNLSSPEKLHRSSYRFRFLLVSHRAHKTRSRRWTFSH